MQAYESFCNQEYKQAMDKYIESKCDPLKVVALYPNLLPENGKSNTVQKTTNNPPPQLSGVQLIDAYRALVPFLTYHRQEFYLHENLGKGWSSATLAQNWVRIPSVPFSHTPGLGLGPVPYLLKLGLGLAWCQFVKNWVTVGSVPFCVNLTRNC